MNTLVVYASKHGAAEKCAKKLSEKLTGKVDVCSILKEKVPELSRYDKVIIGGSIYGGKIQKEISEFCKNNIDVLKEKKVGLFISCIFEKNVEQQMELNFPKELLGEAVVKDSLGYEFKYKSLGFMEKALTKMITKVAPKDDQNLPKLDVNSDISMISEEKINKFVQEMNIA